MDNYNIIFNFSIPLTYKDKDYAEGLLLMLQNPKDEALPNDISNELKLCAENDLIKFNINMSKNSLLWVSSIEGFGDKDIIKAVGYFSQHLIHRYKLPRFIFRWERLNHNPKAKDAYESGRIEVTLVDVMEIGGV